MPCDTIDLGGGGFAIICSRGPKPKPCVVCGAKSSRLCDFPLKGKKAGKTCDAALCPRHAVRVVKDLDYCPAHHRATQPELALGGKR